MHIQHLTQTHKISNSFEENKHIGETLSILFIFSSSDMVWKENKYHRRLQSTSRLQCTKLISLCYSPKVFPFFISSVQPPQWGNMKAKAECSKYGFVFAICVNLACFSVFTERSIPKLWGPTLSKMNNLIIITLNFLFCHNCLCNILPVFFPCAK